MPHPGQRNIGQPLFTAVSTMTIGLLKQIRQISKSAIAFPGRKRMILEKGELRTFFCRGFSGEVVG
jgi:hypothetical protein